MAGSKRTQSKRHFFWIDRAFLDALFADAADQSKAMDLARVDLLVYLFHLRHTNPRKREVSFAGKSKAREAIGIGDPYFGEAIDKLVSLRLIEVTEGNEIFLVGYRLLSGSRDGSERNIRRARPVFLPSDLIDDGKLGMVSFPGIIALLELYANLNLEVFHGVDWRFLSRYAQDPLWPLNYEACSVELYELAKPDHWHSKAVSRNEDFEELKEEGLIHWVPLLLRSNPKDPDIEEAIGEITPNIYDRYALVYKRVWTKLAPNERIVWIARPKDRYLPRTEKYEPFMNRRKEFISRAKKESKEWFKDKTT